MRRTLTLSVSILLYASAAFGQAGAIGLYVDSGFTDCTYVDAAPALVAVYAVHQGTAGVFVVKYFVSDLFKTNRHFPLVRPA